MSKKKKIFKSQLSLVFYSILKFLSINRDIFVNNNFKLFQNIFRVTNSYKQLFFSFMKCDMSFCQLRSAGVLLSEQVSKFKFFKKSIHCINPLVFLLRFKFIKFFDRIYFFEILNFSKKQYLFFKKLITTIAAKFKYILVGKATSYTTKPVKRIKRRVLKLLKGL